MKKVKPTRAIPFRLYSWNGHVLMSMPAIGKFVVVSSKKRRKGSVVNLTDYSGINMVEYYEKKKMG